MKTAKEILYTFEMHSEYPFYFHEDDITDAMKEYATQCCEQALQDAAESIHRTYQGDFYIESVVTDIKNTSIQLP